MSKVTILGDAAVITSNLTLDAIKIVKKYRPGELVLRGGESGKEPIFAIDATDGAGDISTYGVTFGRETKDADKLAYITVILPPDCGDVREYVADKYGVAVGMLNRLETKLPDVIAEIEAEHAAIMGSITVAQ